MRVISIGDQPQSAIDLADKKRWVYTYTYLLSVAVLAHAQQASVRPARCLMIGLGGGSFANFLAQKFPHWQITVVELNPTVIRLARKYFSIEKSIGIIEQDGRQFLRESREKYDIIIMDAFGENFIPPELHTLEFFRLMKSRLEKKGLALMNAWENESLDARELATLRQAFEVGYYIHDARETPGNRIYLLGREMDSEQVLRERMSDGFVEYKFPGQSPRLILSDMKSIHAGQNRAAPITDAKVRALFEKTPLN